MRISKDRAGERFVFRIFYASIPVRNTSAVAWLILIFPSLVLALAFAAMMIALTHLHADHVKLCNYQLPRWCVFPAATQQVLGTTAFLQFFAIRFDGTDPFVDLQDQISSLEVDVELR